MEIENLPVLYEWNPPPPTDVVDDIPETYRIVSWCLDERQGIMVIAKYRNEWVANPWNQRPLIKHLLETLQTALLSHGDRQVQESKG